MSNKYINSLLLLFVSLLSIGQKNKSYHDIFVDKNIVGIEVYDGVKRFRIIPVKSGYYYYYNYDGTQLGKATTPFIIDPYWPTLTEKQEERFNKCRELQKNVIFDNNINVILKSKYGTNTKRRVVDNKYNDYKVIYIYNRFNLVKKTKVISKIKYCNPRKRVKIYKYIIGKHN
jgi:hypothetical protein